MSFFPLAVQVQNFVLNGAGAVAGATTLNLRSFKQIDGTNLTMTQFGTVGYGTIEPGNNTLEEQISFTGITQNANGTATLTGVKTVLFITPYTETSGLAKTHAGATTFTISNDAGFYNAIKGYIDTATTAGAIPATTIAQGIGLVSTAPVDAATPIFVGDNDTRIPTATQAAALAGTGTPNGTTGKYVTNDTIASETVKGIVEEATDAEVAARTATGGTGAKLFITPAKLPTSTSGTATHTLNSNGAQNIAHGLTRVPQMIKITAKYMNSGAASEVFSTYFGTTQSSLSSLVQSNASYLDVTNRLYTTWDNSYATFAITSDSTNIILTWSGNGGAVTGVILWEAFG